MFSKVGFTLGKAIEIDVYTVVGFGDITPVAFHSSPLFHELLRVTKSLIHKYVLNEI